MTYSIRTDYLHVLLEFKFHPCMLWGGDGGVVAAASCVKTVKLLKMGAMEVVFGLMLLMVLMPGARLQIDTC